MEASDLAELAINAQVRLDSSWLLFLTINATIVGGVIFIERTFSVLERSIAIFIYLIVSGMSYIATTNAMNLLGGIYTDLEKFDFLPTEPGYDLIHQIGEIHSNFLWNRPELMTLFYVGGAILSIGAIILDEKLTRTRHEPEVT